MIGDETASSLVRELNELVSDRVAQGWDKYWLDCMRFALPADVSYDQLLMQGNVRSATAAVSSPPAQRTTKTLYDQTSLWAIERLTAGLISLKTPEASQWHSLDVDDPFGHEAELQEEAWMDKLTRYLFKVRSNPKSGFWPAHKAAVRSTCALGDGFIFHEELFGDVRTPWRYEFVPLGECYLTVDMSGQMLRFYRYRNLTAEQIARRWPDSASAKIKSHADDPTKRMAKFPVAHAVIPRDDLSRHKGFGTLKAPYAGVYIDVDEESILGETGYWEMPYIGHSWNRIAGRRYSEGPMALALAEIKSLNEMSKNELISSQQAVRPPLAAYGENMQRINLNAGKVNPNLINGDGKLLVQPIMTHTRPDFAQQVLETRRNNVREMLYLNLWQILIERPDMTATEAMLRSQEKGDLLGPVGISFNHSLSQLVDREIAILGRKGAFDAGSPLEAPESLVDKDLSPAFTSPLDRMRNMDEVVGAQRTVAGMVEVAALKPEIMDKLDVDRYASLLRRGNGAPADLFIEDKKVEQNREQDAQLQQLMGTIEALRAGGEAAGAMGAGAQALGAGAQAVGGSPVNQGPTPAAQEAVAA